MTPDQLHLLITSRVDSFVSRYPEWRRDRDDMIADTWLALAEHDASRLTVPYVQRCISHCLRSHTLSHNPGPGARTQWRRIANGNAPYGPPERLPHGNEYVSCDDEGTAQVELLDELWACCKTPLDRWALAQSMGHAEGLTPSKYRRALRRIYKRYQQRKDYDD